MPSQDEKAIDIVRTSRVDREPTDIFIKHKMPAFDGTIYFMRWKSKKDNREFDTLSFFRDGSDDPVFLWGGEDAVTYFSGLKPSSSVEKAARYVFGLNGVSAIIALTITATICYLVLRGSSEIPGILANALTMILGFFFGSKVGEQKQ